MIFWYLSWAHLKHAIHIKTCSTGPVRPCWYCNITLYCKIIPKNTREKKKKKGATVRKSTHLRSLRWKKGHVYLYAWSLLQHTHYFYTYIELYIWSAIYYAWSPHHTYYLYTYSIPCIYTRIRSIYFILFLDFVRFRFNIKIQTEPIIRGEGAGSYTDVWVLE